MKELKKHPTLSREDTRLYFSKLNQAGAITVLDFLDEGQAAQLCKRLMDEVYQIPSLQEGSAFGLYDNITGKAYEHTLKATPHKLQSFRLAEVYQHILWITSAVLPAKAH